MSADIIVRRKSNSVAKRRWSELIRLSLANRSDRSEDPRRKFSEESWLLFSDCQPRFSFVGRPADLNQREPDGGSRPHRRAPLCELTPALSARVYLRLSARVDVLVVSTGHSSITRSVHPPYRNGTELCTSARQYSQVAIDGGLEGPDLPDNFRVDDPGVGDFLQR